MEATILDLQQQVRQLSQAKEKAIAEARDLALENVGLEKEIKKLKKALLSEDKGKDQSLPAPGFGSKDWQKDWEPVPEWLWESVKRLNSDYLVLVREICQRDAAAVMTLGIPQELVELLADLDERQILKFSRQAVLLAVPRIKNVDGWKDFIKHDFDANQMMVMLLREDG